MLGIGGKFAAARGMVRVPNLAGLSPSDADIALANAGLKRGSQSSSSTSNSSNNNKINTQSIAANTLVDYESVVSYNYEYYVAPYQPTVSYGGCETYNTQSTGGWCDGTTWNYPIYTDQRRRAVYYDGSFAYWDYSCADVTGGGGSEKVEGLCGYVAPVVCTGKAGSNTYTSSCSGGQYYVTTRYWDACGNDIKRVTNFYDCCTAGLVSCTSWSGGQGGQSRVCTYRRSDCSTYTVTENRCAVQTSTTCGSCVYAGYTVGSYKSCTTTTVDSSCNITRTTKSVKC